MTMNIGAMYFHHVTKVEAYPMLDNDVSLHITHELGKRIDKIDIHRSNTDLLLEAFPAPTPDKEPTVFSPIPSIHGANLISISAEKIQFDEFSINLFR